MLKDINFKPKQKRNNNRVVLKTYFECRVLVPRYRIIQPIKSVCQHVATSGFSQKKGNSLNEDLFRERYIQILFFRTCISIISLTFRAIQKCSYMYTCGAMAHELYRMCLKILERFKEEESRQRYIWTCQPEAISCGRHLFGVTSLVDYKPPSRR